MFRRNKQNDHVRFRLRSQGKVFIVITILVTLAAVNTGANLLYIVVGGLISFLIISRVLGGWSLQGMRVTRDAPDATHRDQHFLVTTRMENHKRLLPCMSLRLTSEDEPEFPMGYVLKIPAKRTAVLRVSEVFTRRGVHALAAFHIVSTFPLGLFEARKIVRDAKEIVVYPRIFSARVGLLERMPGSGEAPRVARGDGDEFFALREYQPGDDIRKISWRASARVGKLIVKELEPDTSKFVVLILDNRRAELEAEYDERFEEAVETVASIAATLLSRQFNVAVSSFSGFVPLGEGTGQLLKILDFLARIQPVSDNGEPLPDLSEGHRAAVACVSPRPEQWGQESREFGAPIVHPREVVRA